MLVNDIAAARVFLDRRNDVGECNATALILVGANQGAALGALWLASECCRYEVHGRFTPRLESKHQATDVRCAVWLDIAQKLGGRRIPVLDWIVFAGGKNQVPMGFLYAEGDEAARNFATRCLERLKRSRTGLRLTSSRGLRHLDAEVGEVIHTYATNVLGENGADSWERRDFDEQRFVWKALDGGSAIAKETGESSFRLLPLRWFGAR
jgi:hypothetical protein